MASTFPGTPDSFTNPTGTDSLGDEVGGRTHAQMHADENDAIEAMQAHILAGITVANVQTADYTAVLSDAGKVIELNSATAVVLTIPPASSVAWPTGTVLSVYQAGSGNVSVAAGSGVTIRNLAALRGQYAEASLRYRGSDEWVLEGDLASSSAPALKDYAEVLRTAGSITLNSTSRTAVSSSLDLVLTAATGDLVEFNINALVNVGTDAVQFDVYTLVSSSPVNPFGPGLVPGSIVGIGGWDLTTGVKTMTGGISRVLTSGDISGGTATLRLYYQQGNTTASTMLAAVPALKVWAKNYGQV